MTNHEIIERLKTTTPSGIPTELYDISYQLHKDQSHILMREIAVVMGYLMSGCFTAEEIKNDLIESLERAMEVSRNDRA